MKLFNLFLISFLLSATPFVVSLDRGVDLVDSVLSREDAVSINLRQAPKFLDVDPASDTAIVSMD